MKGHLRIKADQAMGACAVVSLFHWKPLAYKGYP